MRKATIEEHAEIVDNVEAILRNYHVNACYDFNLMAEQIVGCVLSKKKKLKNKKDEKNCSDSIDNLCCVNRIYNH